MARLIDFSSRSGKQSSSQVTSDEREQMAAQIVAIMRAHFKHPAPAEMMEILQSAVDLISAPKLLS